MTSQGEPSMRSSFAFCSHDCTFFKRMVKHCIAAGCSNTCKQNVSLFISPRDPTLRERWTRQVRRTRAGWSGPTATSYLCSNHFTEDCFDESSLMAAKLGFEKRKTLKPDAVPTVSREQKAAPPPSKIELPASVLGQGCPKL